MTPGGQHVGRALLLASLTVVVLHGSASVEAAAKQPCKPSLAACPDEGCGGDPELNKLKNRTDKATDAEEYDVADLLSLEVPGREEWKADRSVLEEEGEGSAVRLSGYLIYAAMTKTPESCNCYLRGEANNDFHLNLVESKSDSKNSSVVVEITPRFRPTGWDLDKLKVLKKKKAYVRVTGWLMLDTMHTGQSAGRGTAWEIHPVTECEVCTKSVSQCDQGKGWKSLATYQP